MKSIKKIQYFILFLFTVLVIACEREYIPTDVQQTDDIVVEGYIEAGDRPLPPYVILTKSASFFRTFDPNKLEQYLVKNALVTVSDGTKTDTLEQVCLNDLSPSQKQAAASLLGLNPDSLAGANLCVYISIFGKIRAQEGGTYTLNVLAEGKKITAVTKIPPMVRLDSIRCIPTPNNFIDSMMQMRGYISDPGGVKNFYRVLIGEQGQNLLASTNSAINDNFFDGKPSFEFPLSKPRRPNQNNVDFETAGLYKKGEKVTVKYACIDEAHFNFWDTAAQSAQNQGPFSTYTRIKSNIKGGIGIWGGLSASYYDVEVPK